MARNIDQAGALAAGARQAASRRDSRATMPRCALGRQVPEHHRVKQRHGTASGPSNDKARAAVACPQRS